MLAGRRRDARRTAEFERLAAGELRGFRVVLLHGQMRAAEKQEAMAAFAVGGADVLVATTVIEVGIDVPNATVMLVENAERYGISQLHQLRGRIGRGEHDSRACCSGRTDSRAPARARRASRRLRARRDRPRAARGGRAGRHAPAGLGQYRVAELPAGRGAARARPRRAPRRSSRATASSRSPSTRCCGRARRGVRRGAVAADPGVRRTAPIRGRSVRVIAGRYGGRRLVAPRGRRDATDGRPRARGAVLDPRRRSTGPRCSTCSPARARWRSRRCRGAPRAATLVDARAGRDRRHRGAIWSARCQRSRRGAPPRCARFLRSGTRGARKYDLVFIDPPYRHAAASDERARRGAAAGARAGRARRHRERPARAARRSGSGGVRRATVRRHRDRHPPVP